MKTTFKIVLACCMAAFHLSAAAAPIIDQNNPNPLAGFCFVNDSRQCGQSFQQDNDNISGAGFYVVSGHDYGTSGTVTLSIFSNYTGGASGLIASGTAANINTNSGWVDVFFAPVAITAGNQYYLLIQSTNPIVAAYGNNTYADGNAVYAGSQTAYASYDLAFRTYYETDVIQVPEPGSFGLLGLGIAGLGLARRKRRA